MTSHASSAPVRPSLRVSRLRHTTLVIELAGQRILVDPCFGIDIGAGVLASTTPALLDAQALGAFDIVCVTSSDLGCFSARSVRQLASKRASCFVPSDDVAAAMRDAGFRRVRVVGAFDSFEVNGVVVSMSPSRGLFDGAAVGFHFAARDRALWHAGAPPPLDVDADIARFARAHAAEVLAIAAEGLRLLGTARTIDVDDAMLVARLCGAHTLMRLADDTQLTFASALLLQRTPAVAVPSANAPARIVSPRAGAWYDVLRH